MLDEEADQRVGAGPDERTDERAAYRADHYERGFTTTSGRVTLKMPKLKGMRFVTAVIERYKRRETSVEEAIIEMYLAGVSARRFEGVERDPAGRTGVSAGTVGSIGEVLPRRKIPALHCALLPQRPGQGSEIEEAAGGGQARSNRRDGVSRGGRRQGRGRGRRPGDRCGSRRPPRWCATGMPRRWRTARCRASIGGALGRTTQSSA